jgi:hypothetical protein
MPACAQEGSLTKVCRRKDKRFYFHLFNDIMLYSEATVLGYRLHRIFYLQKVVVENIDHHSVDFEGAPPNSLKILSDHKSFIAYADSEELKTKWLTTMNQAIVLARACTGTR